MMAFGHPPWGDRLSHLPQRVEEAERCSGFVTILSWSQTAIAMCTGESAWDNPLHQLSVLRSERGELSGSDPAILTTMQLRICIFLSHTSEIFCLYRYRLSDQYRRCTIVRRYRPIVYLPFVSDESPSGLQDHDPIVTGTEAQCLLPGFAHSTF